MKLTFIFALLLSINTFAGISEPHKVRCHDVPEIGTITLVPTSSDSYYYGVEKKCAKHSDIQYDWEDYAYYKLYIAGKELTGVACGEDVLFEFKPAQKFNGKDLAIFMYMDEMTDVSLTIGGVEQMIECEYEWDE